MAAKTKENFINDCCGGFSEIELNIVNNTWRAAIESVAVHSTSTNKQGDSIKPCTCNPKPNAWSGSYHKCVACGGFDEFEERV